MFNTPLRVSERLPLQPTSKSNSASPFKKDSDLDKLANDIGTGNTKENSIRTRYQSPSATVSSFKTTSTNDLNRSPSWLKGVPSLNKTPRSGSPNKSSFHTSTSSPSLPDRNSGYEYLCRIQAIKNWLEAVLEDRIEQSPVELIDYIRFGIHLSKLLNLILPTTRKVFTNDSKLQFKHTENINRFFELLDYMNVPDLFRFELTDLYDAKNVPKVWFCLHALSYSLAKSNSNLPSMENLVGKVEFSDEDIIAANRALLKAPLPNFSNAAGSDRLILPTKTAPRKIQLKRLDPSTNLSLELQNGSPYKLNQVNTLNASNFMQNKSNKSNLLAVQKEPEFISKKTLSNPFTDTPPVMPESSKSTSITTAIQNENSSYGSYNSELSYQILNIIKLQALIRGSNFRYLMFVDRIMLRSFAEDFTQLFSIVRGNQLRELSVHRHRHELIFFKHEIVRLQSAARRKLLNIPRVSNISEFQCVSRLQSAIRGNIIRKNNDKLKTDLNKYSESMAQFQSLLRGKQIASRCRPIIESGSSIEPSVIKLQSVSRRFLLNRKKDNQNLLSFTPVITELQSIIRAGATRTQFFDLFQNFRKYKSNFKDFQSIARGAIVRTKLCNSVLVTLIDEDIVFNDLLAVVRGNSIRKQVSKKLNKLRQIEYSQIVPIQSHFRAVLVRFEKELMLDEVYENVNELVQFQAALRGKLVRNHFTNIENYYSANIDLVIKCQSIIRSNFDQQAYKLLIGAKDPPLSTIQRFAFLLTDNEIDYQEETEIAKTKDDIIQKSKDNEELEQKIEDLDIKLQLLDINKISIEEFLNNKKFNSFKPDMDMLSTSQIGLSKPQRKRLEFYQLIFYLLQTNPTYLSNLILEEPSKGEFHSKLALSLYPVKTLLIDHHLREEFFLMKLINSVMVNDSKYCKSSSQINKGKSNNWLNLFLNFNNHSYQRQHLKLLFGRIVFSIVGNDELDFELDPLIIHTTLREKETKVHGKLDRQATITPQQAIKDTAVSAKFVENLMSLRELSSEALELISKNTNRIPLHVRMLSKSAYSLSKKNFPGNSETQHLAVAGVTLIKHYISPILLYPDNYGISISFSSQKNETLASKICRENLRHLSKVLLQLFSMKPFLDNFLKPLNEYLDGSYEMTATTIKQIINVQSLESEYRMTEYDDVISTQRPRLTLKVSEIIDLVKVVDNNLNIIAPIQEDKLRILFEKLSELNDSASDFVALAEMGHVTLALNPITPEDLLQDLKTRFLLAQAKRALLYIIRVQDGPGLLELLILGIKPEHEVKFKQIIQEEQEEMKANKNHIKKPYDNTSLGDLSNLSYRDLKKLALQTILQLESENVLSRKDSYQALLTDIALDIKNKHSKRISRKRQLEITIALGKKLVEKEIILKGQLKDYNHHVQSILSDLQLQPKDKKFFNIIPVFSKQYFYHRELRKANRLPKFGLYKYLAKKLMEQGILKDYSSKYALSLKLDFMFSCHEVGKFLIEAAAGSTQIAGAFSYVTLDQLLNLQYEKKGTFDLFDKAVEFDTENLVAFIFRKFYDVKKE